MVFTKVFRCDKPTLSGRIYTKEVLGEAIDKFRDRINSGRAIGTINGVFGEVDLLRASHIIINVKEVEEGFEFIGKTLNTPLGIVLASNIDNVNIVPRGYGTMDENNKVDTLELISFDFIGV